MKISVIIPTYNSWHTLRSCIESIKKQTKKPSEIVVVDNASTDDTGRQVKTHFPKVKLVTLSNNLGVTGGRNIGIENASKKSDYLCFFDHDMVADKNMLSELLKVAESNSDAGTVTPKIYYWDKKSIIWSAGTGINMYTGKNWFRNGKDEGQYEKVEKVPIAPAVLLVKKEVIKQIKGFDDTFFAVYEDSDFCFRAKNRGFYTYYSPKAVAYHKIPYDEKNSMLRLLTRLYWVGRNRTIFMKEHGANYYVYLLSLPFFITYYFYLSVRYLKFIAFWEYSRGLLKGLLFRR